MPKKTERLGLNTWLENDIVDFELMNENFRIIDEAPSIVEAGTTTSTYTDSSSKTTTWYYKKYSDGTVEMSAKLGYTGLLCNQGTQAPYYSNASDVNFPFDMSKVYDVQVSMSSNTFGWPILTKGADVNNMVSLRAVSLNKDTESELYKQIYIQVKGVLS